MKHVAALAFLLFAAVATGCAVAADDAQPVPGEAEPARVSSCPPEVISNPHLDQIVITPDGHAGHADPGDPSAPAEDDPLQPEIEPSDPDVGASISVCGCTSDQCVVDWIESNVGCGLCAHVVCDTGTVGGCVPCADQLTGEQGDQGPCLLPAEPVDILAPS